MIDRQAAMRSLLEAGALAMLALGAWAQGMHGAAPPASHFPNPHFGFSSAPRGFAGSAGTRPSYPRHNRFSQGFFYPWLDYGYGYAPYDYGYDYGYEAPPEPSVVVVQPSLPPPLVMQPPPQPIHSEIKEYEFPPEAKESSPYSIALKDGAVRSAIAVWVTDEALHYVDPRGKAAEVPLDSVDRQQTKKLNPGKNVQPWLP
jgi:hypothetical protein